jgi:outer membrane protein assembly factor BamB
VKFSRISTAFFLSVLAAGCSTPVGDYIDRWFGSGPAVKPAELVVLKPTATTKVLWQASVGSAERFVFTPLAADATVTVTGANGQIARFEAASGKSLSRIDAKARLSGGVGGNFAILVVGTPKGEIHAYDPGGKMLWKAQISSDVLSAPQIEQDVVIVRAGDGRLFGLDAATGTRKWVYQRTLPALTVRTHVTVLPYRGAVFAGFPGGRLVAVSAANGNLIWEATVALPKGATELERVADVTSVPVTDGRQVCAAAYQGRVACFGMLKGELLWARDFSSVSGLSMDARNVYASDEKSAIVAFDRSNGASLWKQDKLHGRNVTAPAVVGRFIAVGDLQGYVHFLSREDGSFVARVATDGTPIIAQPVSVDDHVVVQTLKGGVYALAVQ